MIDEVKCKTGRNNSEEQESETKLKNCGAKLKGFPVAQPECFQDFRAFTGNAARGNNRVQWVRLLLSDSGAKGPSSVYNQ
jgi:hypothetical protein